MQGKGRVEGGRWRGGERWERQREPQMEKKVKGAGDVKSKRGRNIEGLVNTASDTHSPSVPVSPSSFLVAPSLYLDKNCEVVRFRLA